jgi:hypothetical protein
VQPVAAEVDADPGDGVAGGRAAQAAGPLDERDRVPRAGGAVGGADTGRAAAQDEEPGASGAQVQAATGADDAAAA